MDKIKIIMISDAHDMEGRLVEKGLQDLFSKDEVTLFNCADLKIEYCIGCFSCRYKTPGKCVHNDGMVDILPHLVASDVIVLLTRMEYGCYSPLIKRILDRTITFETPFLRTANGETHLEPRYPKKRKLLTVAYDENIASEEAVIFTHLTKRNAINFDAEWRRPVFIREGEDIEKKLRRAYGDLLK